MPNMFTNKNARCVINISPNPCNQPKCNRFLENRILKTYIMKKSIRVLSSFIRFSFDARFQFNFKKIHIFNPIKFSITLPRYLPFL